MRVIPLILLLSACATTPAGIRQLEPKAVFQSGKSSLQLEQCLGESKLALLGGPAVVHGPDRTAMSFGLGGRTTLLIDIAPPTVSVRSPYGFTGPERRWIEGCL